MLETVSTDDDNSLDLGENLLSFTSPFSESLIESQLNQWRIKWSTVDINDLPENAVNALQHCSPVFFPVVHVLLQIYATIPVNC